MGPCDLLRVTIPIVLLLATVLNQLGCSDHRLQPKPYCGEANHGHYSRLDNLGHWVEVISPLEYRLFLSGDGACLVDLAQSGQPTSGEGSNELHVLIPASASDILAMIKVCEAAKVYEPGMVKLTKRLNSSREWIIRWHTSRDSQPTTTRLRLFQSSPLWNGILKELRLLGSFPIAQAVEGHVSAERYAAHGNKKRACNQYRKALDSLFRWEAFRKRVWARPGLIYEPEVTLAAPMHEFQKGNYVTALRSYRTLWAERLSVKRDSGVVVVSFQHEFAKETRVPSEVYRDWQNHFEL